MTQLAYSRKNVASKFQDGVAGSIVTFPSNLEVDEKRMGTRIIFADGKNRDGVGDRLRIEGIDLWRHRSNPVVLWEHGKAGVQLPIAMSEDPDTKQYTVELDPMAQEGWSFDYFYQGTGLEGTNKDDEYDHALFCEQVFHLIVKRFLRGGSIGYQIIEAQPLPPDFASGGPPVQGNDLIRVLKLEHSVVTIPANGLTVKMGDPIFEEWRERAREVLCAPMVCGKSLAAPLRKAIEPYAAEAKIMSNGVETKAGRHDKQDRYTSIEGGDGKFSASAGGFGTEEKGKREFTSYQEAEKYAQELATKWRTSNISDQTRNHKAMSAQNETSGGALRKPAEQGTKTEGQEVTFDSLRIGDRFVEGFDPTVLVKISSDQANPDGIGTSPVQGKTRYVRPKDWVLKKSMSTKDLPKDTEATDRIRAEIEKWSSWVEKFRSEHANHPVANVRKQWQDRVDMVDALKQDLARMERMGKDLPKDTEATVEPPLNQNLTETNVPPSRWKPGCGAEKMKAIRAKYKAIQTKAYQEVEVNQLKQGDLVHQADGSAKPVKYVSGRTIVYMDGERFTVDVGYKINVVKSLPKETKSINVRFKRKVVKGYANVQMKFDVTGMDCKKQNEFIKDMKAAGCGEPSGGRWTGEGEEKALDAPLKTASYNFDLEPGKSVAEAIGNATGIGEKHGAKYMGNIKSIGDKMKTKAMEMPQEVVETKEGTEETDNGFNMSESLGSQVLKRFHQDFSKLMQDYDEVLPVLDHTDVKDFLTENLKDWEKKLSHVEKSHKKWFKDVDPIEGVMDVEEKDHLPGEIDDAEIADSDPVEEPTPEEAMEGMEKVAEEENEAETPEERSLRLRKTKSVRNKYRGKSVEDKEEDKEKEEKAVPTDVTPEEEDGVKWFKGLAEHHQTNVAEAKGYLKELSETQDEAFSQEHKMKAYYHGENLSKAVPDEAEGEVSGDVPVDETKDLTEGEADKIKDEMLDQAADNVQKSIKACIRESAKYFKDVAAGDQFGEDQRQKAGALCKDLDQLDEEEKTEPDAEAPVDEQAEGMQTKSGRFLTRQEYDSLVSSHPDWMKTKWNQLEKKWEVGGVRVSGNEAVLSELANLMGKSLDTKSIKDQFLEQSRQVEELTKTLETLAARF